jgi:DNA-binding Xre family transcriptional regulator
MNDTSRIVATLKKLLRSRGITYAELGRRLALSEASVKRLFSRETLTLARLEAICVALDVDFYEVARLARGHGEPTREMTRAQETALAADPKLLAAFYLVFNGWTFDEIVERYTVTAAQCTGWMVRLDRLGVIALMPGNRIRVRVPRHTRLAPDGPIRRKYGAAAVADFLAPQFDKVGGYFVFEFSDLSQASRELLQRRLERLVAEFNELAEFDAPLRASARQTVGLALGIRPWSMENAIELAPRRRLRAGG